MVYGSAMLGPKIGNGFYQNLKGNFSPITMDLWFMRAWGRITNTGVQKTDMVEQLERLEAALIKEKKPVPRTREGKIKLAAEIYKKHEKDFAQAAEDDEDYDKSELMKASERLTLYAEGMMVEQPKNASQRRWVTAVFNRALEKMRTEHGITLNSCGRASDVVVARENPVGGNGCAQQEARHRLSQVAARAQGQEGER